MKTFVRLLTLLLALLMLAMTVVACDDGGGDDNIDRTATEDEFMRTPDDLDQYNLNYGGETIKILARDDGSYPEFGVNQITSDNVLMAVHQRNQEIERRLNVKLEFIEVPRAQQITLAVSNHGTTEHAYDLIAAYSRTETEIAMRGCLADINAFQTSYINLAKPWWPDAMVETMSLGDSLYFFSGDISPNVLAEMQVLYFNKTLLAEYWDETAQQMNIVPEKNSKGENVVTPAAQMVYNMAYDGKWTLDELIKLTKGPEGHQIGDISKGTPDVKDLDDSYGFVSIGYCVSFFYSGCNLDLIENTGENETKLRISDDFGSMKTVKLVSKLGDWYKSESVAIQLGSNYRQVMMDGRTLFTAVRARHAGNEYAEVDFDLGIMPCPKYDGNQANYYTAIGNPFTIYGISRDLDPRGDKEAAYTMMSAVVECWASETFRLVTPQVFEVNMQLKYAETQNETDMFEIVRTSITFDLGRLFAPEMYGMDDMPTNAAVAGTSWVSTHASYKKSLDKKLEAIVKSIVVEE